MSLLSDVAAFTVSSLDCADHRFPKSGKVIHDAVWGSINLNPAEVALLDSRLLQRLRELHQTGFAFLTFPSARHSRFEHSLGVVHQTDRHLKALRTRFPGRVTDDVIAMLRTAALLHDCSHGLFSHTSEEIYRFLPDILEFTSDGGDYEQHKASELIARFILESDRFSKVIEFLAKHGPVHGSGSRLAALICGDHEGVEPHERWWIEIINGPLDADKLDYIARDSLHTGLPLSVDLDRLWLATEIQPLEKGCLENIDRDQIRLVINRSGLSAVEGILFARFQLTSAVYQHPKIRACDCLFKAWIEEEQRNGRFCRTIDFIEATDVTYMAAMKPRHRGELLKRALVLSARTTGIGEPEQVAPALLNLVEQGNATEDGWKRLRSLAGRIAVEANVPEGERNLVWIDLPAFPKVEDLALTVVNLGTSERPKYEYLDDVFPVRQWRTMFQDRNWRGHVFAPAKYLDCVGRAAREVLEAELPDVKIQDEAYTWCKRSPGGR